MRICVISSTVFPCPPTGYSGLEMIAWQIADGLGKRGHEVILVAPEGSTLSHGQVLSIGPPGSISEEEAYGGCKRPGLQRDGYWKALLGCDAVIDHSWQKWSYMLKREGKLKAPILGVCHAPINTMMASPPQVEKPCIVCISKDQADHFTALFNKPARYAYNGIDTNFYKPINLPRSDRFLFLARFSSIKGPDLAIEACLKAGVGLDLVGDTSITNEPELLAKCKAMADGEQIRIIGNQNRGSCVWWYSQAKALLHMNERFREPYGLAPVESLACECPVICFDNGAMRETVLPSVSGFLVTSVSGCVDILKSDVLKTLDRKKCRESVATKFNVDTMVGRYESLCREAIDGGW